MFIKIRFMQKIKTANFKSIGGFFKKFTTCLLSFIVLFNALSLKLIKLSKNSIDGNF
jgi:hypothetical protein